MSITSTKVTVWSCSEVTHGADEEILEGLRKSHGGLSLQAGEVLCKHRNSQLPPWAFDKSFSSQVL